MRKQLPIGIENFEEAQSYYYVDKTLLIREITETMMGKSILVTRPRRFGKSLMASMLEYFFSVQKDSKALFQDKKIAACENAMVHLNKYPVIRLDMKSVKGATAKEIINRCKDIIAELYHRFDFLLADSKMSGAEKRYYLNVTNLNLPSSNDYQDSIRKLSYLLAKHYNHKVVIIIDEYDTPIESSYESKCFDACMPFFKELYSNAVKGNENLSFAFLTGVLEISKESLFSGLNNLNVYSVIDHRFSSYFGFTEEETKQLLEEYGLSSSYDEVSKWYGGYEFGNNVLFNPWSTLNFIERSQTRSYWINTGSNNLLQELMNGHVKEEFVELVNNASKPIEFNNAVSYRDFEYDENAIYSYLVQSGYLTAKYVEAPRSYLIKIPNQEIYEVFKNDIIARGFNKTLLGTATRLRRAIETQDEKTISSLLEEYVLSSFSYFDLTNEKNYQVMLTGILAVLFDTYVVKSEVIGRKGRCDIMISPKEKGSIGIIFEVKCHNGESQLSRAKLRESAKSAIRQIERQRYYAELQRRECSKILLYGIAFDIHGSHEIAFKEGI